MYTRARGRLNCVIKDKKSIFFSEAKSALYIFKAPHYITKSLFVLFLNWFTIFKKIHRFLIKGLY